MKKLLYSTLTFSALALLITGCSSTKKEIKPKEYTSVPLYMAASAGCTAAGALTILGAASTIIIIQRAEKEGESLSFLTFLKSGIPITLAAVVIYSVWIWVVGIL